MEIRMQIHKSEAERMLGVSPTTFYNRVNKLGITLITKTDNKGKSSYLELEDIQKMAIAMGKKLEEWGGQKAEEESTNEKGNKNGAVKDMELQEIKEERFSLQLKIKEQEEALKANNEVISLYKEQTQQLQNQQQQAQSQFNLLYLQIIKVSNRATGFLIACIAMAIILVLFIGLMMRGKLRF